MKIYMTPPAKRDYIELPARLQRAVDKQLNFLVTNIRHPSLQSKKYDERNDIWQGRVNNAYRFYFIIVGEEYRILRIIPHPK